MRTEVKSSKGAQGARTASPRKHLYKVRIDGYGRWRKSDSSSDHTADIYHTDIYEATSIYEALGMAFEAVQKEHPLCDLYARRFDVHLDPETQALITSAVKDTGRVLTE